MVDRGHRYLFKDHEICTKSAQAMSYSNIVKADEYISYKPVDGKITYV